MTTNQTTPTEGENVTDASTTNYSGEPGDGPATFAQLRRGIGDSTTVFGQGAGATVTVDDGELELTLTVDEFDDPAHLLDHDILSVVLAARDIPQEDDSA